MRLFFCMLSFFTVLGVDCRASLDTPSIPLSFYVVSEEKLEDGRFISTPDLPKLGYVSTTPALVITKLKAVTLTEERSVMVDENGNQKAEARPAISIIMYPEDARKFTALTEQAIGKRVLLMLGNKPLIAPTVRAPISTPSLMIIGRDVKETEEALERLVK